MSDFEKHIELNRKLVVHLLHTANWLDAKISARLKEFGISHVQFNILRVLESRHPKKISVSELKEGIIFNQADMTRLLDKLHAKGLISRETCPVNRRKVDLGISSKGLDLLLKLQAVFMEELDAYFIDTITSDEAEFITKKLKEIRLKEQ